MVSRYERRTGGIESSVPQQLESPENFVRSLEQDSLRLANQMTTTAGELFKTDFEIASRQQISDIYAQSPNDPDKLKENFDKALNGLIRGAPMQQSLQLRQSFEALASTHLTKAAENKLRVDTDRLRENSLTIMNQSINDMEHRASDMLSNNQAVAFDASRAMQDSRLQLENELNRVDSQGNPFYSADQRVKMRDQANQSVMEIGLRRWFDEQPDKIVARQQIVDGDKDFRFYNQDGELDLILNPAVDLRIHNFDRLDSYMQRAIEVQLKQMDDLEADNRVQMFKDGTLLLDPKSKDDLDAVDRDFEANIIPSLQGMSPQEQAEAKSSYAILLGTIPRALKSELRSTIRNGNPDQMSMSASIVSRINDERPELLNDLSSDDISYSIAYYDMVSQGIPGEKAQEILDKQFDPTQKPVTDMRRKAFQDANRRGNINPQRDLRDAFHRGWFFWNRTQIPEVPEIRDPLIAQYNSILEEEYLRSGDLDVAKKTAQGRISGIYGVTEVGGTPTIMPYPPEKFYSVPGLDSQEWISDQLFDVAKRFQEGVSREDVILSTDSRTAKETSGDTPRPTYPILIRDENGALAPLLNDEGRMVRFAPNTESIVRRENERKETERIKDEKYRQELVERYKVAEESYKDASFSKGFRASQFKRKDIPQSELSKRTIAKVDRSIINSIAKNRKNLLRKDRDVELEESIKYWLQRGSMDG